MRRLQQLERRRIAHRNASNVDWLASVFGVNNSHGPVDDGQRLQPEKVELDQSDRLDVILVELRNDIRGTFFAIKRCEVREVIRRDDNTAGMFAGIARESLERHCKINHRRNFFVILVHLGQFIGLLQCFFERHADFKGHQFCDAVYKAVRLSKYPSRVANYGFSRHRAEGNNLRDAISSVARCNIVNHAIATFHTEINIKIGHRHTFRVQEALEQQIMLQGIEVCNSQHPRHQ